MTPQTLFVTGTSTGVGKTLISAALCRALAASYWKPLQTGAVNADNDTQTVALLGALSAKRLFAPARTYQAAASPEWAATLERTRVSVAQVMCERPVASGALVIEGAGGVLVPLNGRETMLDLMAALAAGIIVVAHSGLGTVNHTLLTLAALRGRQLDVRGVVLSGAPAPHNGAAIERHGGVTVAQVPQLNTVSPSEVAALAPKLAQALGLQH